MEETKNREIRKDWDRIVVSVPKYENWRCEMLQWIYERYEMWHHFVELLNPERKHHWCYVMHKQKRSIPDEFFQDNAKKIK